MGTELNQAFFSTLFMLINVEGRQDSTPEGVVHWLHLVLDRLDRYRCRRPATVRVESADRETR